MPPIPLPPTPRVVVYYQTQHHPDGTSCSILPVLTQTRPPVTHVIVAAIHLNEPASNITLNDDPPSHPRYLTLWAELRVLQASGIKVMGMLGGAAKGSFTRLDRDDATFEEYYTPLRELICTRGLDGLDLDVEEPMNLSGVIRLIDRLKSDFGSGFIITLAPVAAALMSDNPRHNLSGFSYEALEVMRGSQIAWYNTQFYCGWGDMRKPEGFDLMIARGWPPEKVVVGLVTNPDNGSGWVPFEVLSNVLTTLQSRYPTFGGVMGWEYFNSLPGGKGKPWEWAAFMTQKLRSGLLSTPVAAAVAADAAGATKVPDPILSSDVDTTVEGEAPVPLGFSYYSDGSVNE